MAPVERLVKDMLLTLLLVFRFLFGPEWYELGWCYKSISQKTQLSVHLCFQSCLTTWCVSKVRCSLWERVTCLLPLLSQNNSLAVEFYWVFLNNSYLTKLVHW